MRRTMIILTLAASTLTACAVAPLTPIDPEIRRETPTIRTVEQPSAPDTTPCDPLTQPSCVEVVVTTTTTVPYVPCDLDQPSCGTPATVEPCVPAGQPSCQE